MIFESPPFVECPRCHQQKFGVLRIESASYDRRCANCGYPSGTGRTATFWLPELEKKLIYLDQSILSNFMKALNTRLGRYKDVDPKWKMLFAKIDTLVKLQVVVCPDSDVHRAESIVYRYGEDVKRIYELLSHGVTFHDSNRIWFQQHLALFNSFVDGTSVGDTSFQRSRSIPDSVHAWQDKLLITTNLPTDPMWIEMFEKQKQNNHQRLSVLFEKWRQKPKRDFNYWFAIEIADANTIAKEQFERPLLEVARARLGSENAAMIAISKYFKSDYPSMAIQSRIGCALFAILAHKANHGMKRLKDEGVMNDFKALSIALPYCDAVVVDNQTAGLLREIPKGTLNIRARVFCNSEIDAFSEYLTIILEGVSEEHLEKVREVYGESWGEPYLTVFEQE